MRFICFSLFLSVSTTCFAQKTKTAKLPNSPEPQATASARRMDGLRNREAAEKRSLVENVAFRNIGPTIMSGRVTDIDVSPSDPSHFYVAYASGGIFYTENNGTSFTPIFDHESSITIGDIAVSWNNTTAKEIWVGTGECNSSRSSYAGTGIFKSTDGGKTWQHHGLEETQHIGKVLLHPTWANHALVAAIGHLHSPSPERGIYKTTDGGLTWKKTLFINENTGAIDLVPDPNNPDIIYAVTWHRERRAWNFTEAGAGTGIWESNDGGNTWSVFTTIASGFPSNDAIGRIGLTIFPGNSNHMYAVVDNQTLKQPDTTKPKTLSPARFRNMSRDAFLKLDTTQLSNYLRQNHFPKQYTVATITARIKAGTLHPIALADFVSDANNDLFNRPITGAEVYRTDDGGKSWKKVSDKALTNLFYTYGYYFGKIWVSPFDVNEVTVAGVELMRSTDGGKTWKGIDGDNQHGDHHALWISPTRKGHLINGNDGGINISWDNGTSWFKANTPAVGQFYAINVDMAMPYNVYGGLQDNGVWTGSSDYVASTAWHAYGEYPWRFICGGDGMQVMVDPRDNNTVYTGYQFGHYARIDKSTLKSSEVRPQMELGDAPLRFNWQTPIWLSVHNSDILYMGAQRLFRSLDRGDHFQSISDDLTRGGRVGDIPYGTLTTIHESPLKFGLLYVGSDDGLIHVSKNGGAEWVRISDELPQHLRVSRIQASAHTEGRVYATLSGFQWDHFESYVYLSDDYGEHWKRIALDLPTEPVNVIREDPVNPNLLFIGTDNGLYVSLDRGLTTMRMQGGLPVVAVHDVVIHPREHEVVVGTHGRSIYSASIAELEKYNDSIRQKELYVFDFEAGVVSAIFSDADEDVVVYGGRLAWSCANEQIISIDIRTADDVCNLIHLEDSSEAGLNFFDLELEIDSTQVDAYKAWCKKNVKDYDESAADTLLEPRNYLLLIQDKKGNRIKKIFVAKEPS